MDSTGDAHSAAGARPQRKNSFIPSLDDLANMFGGQSHASETMDFGDNTDNDLNSMKTYLEEMDQPGPQRAPSRRRSVFQTMMSAPDPSQLEIPDKHKEPPRRVSCGDAPHELQDMHNLKENGVVHGSILNWFVYKPQHIESIAEDNDESLSSSPAFQAPPMQTATPITDAARDFGVVGKGRASRGRGLRSLNVMAPSAW